MSDGSIAHHIALLRTLDAYDSAQKAAELCPWNEDQGFKSDRMHIELLRVAMLCGFEPGGQHRHLGSHEWAVAHAERVKGMFPRHVEEAQRRKA